MAVRALVISDDARCRREVADGTAALGLTALEAGSAAEARPALDEGVAIVFLSLELSPAAGGNILPELARRYPDVPVVVVAPDERLSEGVELLRCGAYDVVCTPLSEAAFEATVHRARGESRMRREVRWLREERNRRAGFQSVVGSSPPMRKVYAQLRHAAPSMVNIMLLGETGTGKELVARALHHEGPRREGPLVSLHCDAVPGELLERSLYGHRAEDVAGAIADHPGHILAAQGGTLFIDDIEKLPMPLQKRLLDTLHTRTISPIANGREIELDVRIVTATDCDVRALMAGDVFLRELLERLAAFPVEIPPLRARRTDIPELAYHFLAKHRADAGRGDVTRIDDKALRYLETQTWPGNVRQLEDCIRHAILRCGPGNVLTADMLHVDAPADVATNGVPEPAPTSGPLRASVSTGSQFHDPQTGQLLPLREIEERAFRIALEEHGGNTTRAAKALGVARATFYRRLKTKKSA